MNKPPTDQHELIELEFWLAFFWGKDPGPTRELKIGREKAYEKIKAALLQRDALLSENEKLKACADNQELIIDSQKDAIRVIEKENASLKAEVEQLTKCNLKLHDDYEALGEKYETAEAALAKAEPVLKAIREARTPLPTSAEFWIDDQFEILKAARKYREEEAAVVCACKGTGWIADVDDDTGATTKRLCPVHEEEAKR